jgi:catechol 2,3-dioxygenase-like lactoylglutathione lyase family enzyme
LKVIVNASPFKLIGIDHIVLRVVEPDQMLAFYCGTLGCTVDNVQLELGLTQLRAGRSLIDLIAVDGPLGRKGGCAPTAEGRNLDHFCLTLSPCDEAGLVSYLGAQGVVIEESGTRYGADGEGPSLYVRDPEGNTVELKRSAAPTEHQNP